MGTAINVKCGKCNYNGSFMLGTGKYYALVENCLEALPEKRADELYPLLEKYPIKDFTFEYRLFQCDDCLFLFDHGRLNVVFENQRAYLNQVECPSCQKDMNHKHIPIDKINEITCPICTHTGEMSLTDQMEWE